MGERHSRSAMLLLLWLTVTGAAMAGVTVELESPRPDEPAYGLTEIRAEVASDDPLDVVQFFVDGELVGLAEKPPFSIRHDFGQANVEHHVRVVAKDILGGRDEASVATGFYAVDEEAAVALFQLFVNVTDRSGRGVEDLGPSDFKVADDEGNRQEIVGFDAGNLPLSAVLLVDASESMKGEALDAALAGVQSFLGGCEPEDEVLVGLFSDRLHRLVTVTDQDRGVVNTLSEVVADGGTAVNDHLYYALNRLDLRLGRRVVILLSDGSDVTSLLDMEQVLWRARRSQAITYWLRLDDPKSGAFASSWRSFEETERQLSLLEQMVQDSGGRILRVGSIDRIDDAFARVIRELKAAYVLGFQPSVRYHDGRWRPVTVKVDVPGVRVRARAGFVDE
ncbi:MAG: VWA domain-containing protein [Thermoanaerobaculia bacterium]|nr:VWA domain-containing protein [Thermoanaerobaculia bacterium]